MKQRLCVARFRVIIMDDNKNINEDFYNLRIKQNGKEFMITIIDISIDECVREFNRVLEEYFGDCVIQCKLYRSHYYKYETFGEPERDMESRTCCGE